MKKPLLVASLVAAATLAFLAIYLLRPGFFGAESQIESKEPVIFRIHAPDAKSVFVAGSFNSWQTVEYRLDKKEEGMWETTVLIAPGRYEYKFLVDTVWVYDIENPIKVPAPLPYVGYNSVLEVKRNRQSDVDSPR